MKPKRELWTDHKDMHHCHLQGVPGSSECITKLATFSEAILPKDWPLAFLAAPVLEDSCVPPPFAWPALKLRSPPVLTTVLHHAQHLSRDAGQSVLASWPAQAMSPELACGKLLEYLDSQVGAQPPSAVRDVVLFSSHNRAAE
jgi:hypothetical protein